MIFIYKQAICKSKVYNHEHFNTSYSSSNLFSYRINCDDTTQFICSNRTLVTFSLEIHWNYSNCSWIFSQSWKWHVLSKIRHKSSPRYPGNSNCSKRAIQVYKKPDVLGSYHYAYWHFNTFRNIFTSHCNPNHLFDTSHTICTSRREMDGRMVWRAILRI